MRENVICGSRKFAEGELRRGFTRSQRKPQITVCLKSREIPKSSISRICLSRRKSGPNAYKVLCTKGLRCSAFACFRLRQDFGGQAGGQVAHLILVIIE